MIFTKMVRLAGLDKVELAQILGVTVDTVYHWKDSPPNYATAYLKLLIEFNRARL